MSVVSGGLKFDQFYYSQMGETNENEPALSKYRMDGDRGANTRMWWLQQGSR